MEKEKQKTKKCCSANDVLQNSTRQQAGRQTNATFFEGKNSTSAATAAAVNAALEFFTSFLIPLIRWFPNGDNAAAAAEMYICTAQQ